MEFLREGVNDPGIFKAIVIVGGPGSGKSTLVRSLGVKALGLKHVVSDHFFEHLLKKNGKSLDLSKAGDYSNERNRARSLTNSKEQHYVDGRLGVVYESSLSSVAKAAGKIKVFRQTGYEVKLIYIAVDKKTAMERNRNRARKVPDDIVLQLHGDIAKNMQLLTKVFHKKDIHLVRSGHDEFESDVGKTFKALRTWITKPPKTAKAKQWIAAQRKGLGESKIPPQFLSKIDSKKNRKNRRKKAIAEYVEFRGGKDVLSGEEKNVLAEMIRVLAEMSHLPPSMRVQPGPFAGARRTGKRDTLPKNWKRIWGIPGGYMPGDQWMRSENGVTAYVVSKQPAMQGGKYVGQFTSSVYRNKKPVVSAKTFRTLKEAAAYADKQFR